MTKILLSFCLIGIILCLSDSSFLIDTEEHIIEGDHFECVENAKRFTLKPNKNKKYAFIASNSTNISQININNDIIPQAIIEFTEISYLNINPEVEKPICFYILYSKKDLIELKMEKKYKFYVLGDEYNEIKLKFELSDLLKYREIHLDISTKYNNTIFDYIYIYRRGDYNYGDYSKDKDIIVTPLHKTIEIRINPYLKDTKQYDEFTLYFYMTGRVKYRSLVITGIVFFYFSIFLLFFVFLFYCNRKESGNEEKKIKLWEYRLDGMGKRFNQTYFWPCLKN